MRVVRVDGTALKAGDAGDGHHPGIDRSQQWHQEVRRQRPVAQMVDAELHLEPVCGHPFWQRHEPGIVHQQVDTAMRADDFIGRRAHRRQVTKVQFDDLQRRCRVSGEDLRPGHCRLGLVPRRHHHVLAGAGQRLGGLQSQAAVCTGDNGGAAGKITNIALRPAHD